MCRSLIEKDPEKRMTVAEILDELCVVNAAAKLLPEDVFRAEFPQHIALLPHKATLPNAIIPWVLPIEYAGSLFLEFWSPYGM